MSNGSFPCILSIKATLQSYIRKGRNNVPSRPNGSRGGPCSSASNEPLMPSLLLHLLLTGRSVQVSSGFLATK
ncbi:hypothetical protein OUZ56_001815 [Daphnia magna]|uniref:Uncharacterized protein n=1 Tax=Daphnia magna TaxID=35525 RepID=A0ABR0A4A6_9CRUS|nr:hypothetical protein OUZ56_001815 [Daphnia magna]